VQRLFSYFSLSGADTDHAKVVISQRRIV